MKALLAKEEFTRDIVANGLKLDCSEICLTQNSTNEPRVWLLSGSLEFDVRKGVSARLFSTDPDRPRKGIHEFFASINEVRSGEFFPPHSYYSLRATDVSGNVWISDHVHLREDDHQTHSIVNIESAQIELSVPAPDEKDYAHLIFVDELDIPQNVLVKTETWRDGIVKSKMDHTGSEGTIRNASVKFFKSDGAPLYYDLIAKPTEGNSLPINFSYKITETLRFLIAGMISFAVSESVYGEVRRIILAKTAPLRKR